MIIGVGCDIIEVERLKKSVDKESFRETIFAPAEIVYCEEKGAHNLESYAARFAGKEAVAKALGTGFRQGVLQEITITNDDLGQPSVLLSGYFKTLAAEKGVKKIHISLSHCKEYAVAQVVLED